MCSSLSAGGGKRICDLRLETSFEKPGSGKRNPADSFKPRLSSPFFVYPVSLHITGKLCVVVGGGNVAERKVLSLLQAHALVRIISPQLTEVLLTETEKSAVDWRNRGYQRGDLDGALLVFAATDKKEIQHAVLRDAQQAGVLINVADAPELCDFQVPALIRRENLHIAVSTNGASPALAAKIRRDLEKKYGDEYVILLRLMSLLRRRICRGVSSDWIERKRIFQNILHEDIIDWIKEERWEQVSQHLATVLGPDIHFDLSDFTELREKEIKPR
ncbi:MAG: bifunctional precorrin-2 dehydrogenase/sirohydrochlorin ferrochelatase [Candidatus Electrothrix sp. EH2]|nr:bifunctional precorrin-2 dehydrogenase/sirohydrochlorin ferrochelatase [Candidatus Electrothrix sp. EH2]